MSITAKKALVSVLICVAAFVLFCEVVFCAGGWYWAFKVTGARLWIVPIIAGLLAVGWVPLLLHRYTRKTFLFGLLIMTGAFAITAAVMAMLIVTGDSPRLLKPIGLMSVSWIAGGLWGWVITYLDRQKWRIGEKLDQMAFGRGPIDDARARRPIVVVAAVTVTAIFAVGGIWMTTREKLFSELWAESDYNGRMWILETRVPVWMFYGKTEGQLEGYFGREHDSEATSGASQDGPKAERLRWWIGEVPPDANDAGAPKQAWLDVKMENGRATSIWVTVGTTTKDE